MALAGAAEIREQRWRGSLPVTLLQSVSRGAEGVVWHEAGIESRAAGYPTRSVNTLGAGDVWHGAITLTLAEGAPLEVAACFANAPAALKCTRLGGRSGAPTRPEVAS